MFLCELDGEKWTVTATFCYCGMLTHLTCFGRPKTLLWFMKAKRCNSELGQREGIVGQKNPNVLLIEESPCYEIFSWQDQLLKY